MDSNQNQPSEVKEGGALENAVQHIRDLLAFSEQMITAWPDAEITVERRKNADHLRTVLDALAARPPSMERGEAEGWRETLTAAADRLDQLSKDMGAHWADRPIEAEQLRTLAAAPSPAPSAWNAVAEAFRKGAMAALGCEPWDDADDFFSLVGMDYAQGKPFPPTMPKPRIGKSAEPDEIKAAYQQGWNDREADIIERAERILPAPSAVEMAGVDRVALARAMFDAANDDLGNILVLGCGEHNYSDPEDAAWATALLMADSAILALATASREKGAES